MSITRRTFMTGSIGLVAWSLLGCTGDDDAGPELDDDNGAGGDYWSLIEEARRRIRTSPDHLPARYAALVAAGDVDGLVVLARSLQPVPTGTDNWNDVLEGRRWGTRGLLRSGVGTPREIADLVRDGLTDMGMDAAVVRGDPILHDELVVTRPTLDFAPPDLSDIINRLGIDVPGDSAPIDPEGTAAAAIGSEVLALAGITPPDANRFGDPSALPTVVFGADDDASLVDLWGPDGGVRSAAGEQFQTQDEPQLTAAVTVTILASKGLAPESPVPLVQASWAQEDLVGRRIQLGFVPVVGTREELLTVKPASVQAWIPSMSLAGDDLDADSPEAEVVAGDAVTLSGTFIATGAEPVGDPSEPNVAVTLPGDGDPGRVAEVTIASARASGFPRVELEVEATDEDGESVVDLAGSAFTVTDDNGSVGAVIERSQAVAPRIVFLVDHSDSVPEAFRNSGAAEIATQVAESILATIPDATFAGIAVSSGSEGQFSPDVAVLRDAIANGSSLGSTIWPSLADVARRTKPTLTVLITDAVATDGPLGGEEQPAPDPSQAIQITAGSPVLVVLVGADTRPEIADRIASLTGGSVVTPADATAAVGQLGALVPTTGGSYRLLLAAPVDGPEVRTFTVTVGTAPPASVEVRVPPTTDRSAGDALVGLHIEVAVPGRNPARRTIAGWTLAGGVTLSGERLPTPAMVDDVKMVMTGVHELVVEAGSPTPSVALDQLLTARLRLRPVIEATTDDERFDAVAASDPVSPRQFVLAAALEREPGTPITHDLTARYSLASKSRRLRDGEEVMVTSVDLLPVTAFASADRDLGDAMARTAARSARLGVVEDALVGDGTVSRLDGADLVLRTPDTYDDDRDALLAFHQATSGWGPQWEHVVPATGIPVALWAIDRSTGSIAGLLPDGRGGAEEVARIERVFDEVIRYLELTEEYQPGAIGKWAGFEKAKAEQLRKATLAIATLEAPADPFGDLRDQACDAAESAAGDFADGVLGAIAPPAVSGALDEYNDLVGRLNDLGGLVGAPEVSDASSSIEIC